jgi:hypothetical protein
MLNSVGSQDDDDDNGSERVQPNLKHYCSISSQELGKP